MPEEKKTLTEVFTDVADAIREKKESEEPICPLDFADEIANMETDPTADFESDRWYHKGSDGMESGGIGDHGVYSLNGGANTAMTHSFAIYTGRLYMGTNEAGPLEAPEMAYAEKNILEEASGNSVSNGYYHIDGDGELFGANADTMEIGQIGDGLFAYDATSYGGYVYGVSSYAYTPISTTTVEEGHLYTLNTDEYSGSEADLYYSEEDWGHGSPIHEADTTSISDGLYQVSGNFEAVGDGQIEEKQLDANTWNYVNTSGTLTDASIAGSNDEEHPNVYALGPNGGADQLSNTFAIYTDHLYRGKAGTLQAPEKAYAKNDVLEEASTTSLSDGLYEVSGDLEAFGSGSASEVSGTPVSSGWYLLDGEATMVGSATVKEETPASASGNYLYRTYNYTDQEYYYDNGSGGGGFEEANCKYMSSGGIFKWTGDGYNEYLYYLGNECPVSDDIASGTLVYGWNFTAYPGRIASVDPQAGSSFDAQVSLNEGQALFSIASGSFPNHAVFDAPVGVGDSVDFEVYAEGHKRTYTLTFKSID